MNHRDSRAVQFPVNSLSSSLLALLVGLSALCWGHAVLARNEPIPNIRVVAKKHPNGIPLVTVTNKDGIYKFIKLTPGKYDLIIVGQRKEAITVDKKGTIAGMLMRNDDGTVSYDTVIPGTHPVVSDPPTPHNPPPHNPPPHNPPPHNPPPYNPPGPPVNPPDITPPLFVPPETAGCIETPWGCVDDPGNPPIFVDPPDDPPPPEGGCEDGAVPCDPVVNDPPPIVEDPTVIVDPPPEGGCEDGAVPCDPVVNDPPPIVEDPPVIVDPPPVDDPGKPPVVIYDSGGPDDPGKPVGGGCHPCAPGMPDTQAGGTEHGEWVLPDSSGKTDDAETTTAGEENSGAGSGAGNPVAEGKPHNSMGEFGNGMGGNPVAGPDLGGMGNSGMMSPPVGGTMSMGGAAVPGGGVGPGGGMGVMGGGPMGRP